MRGFSMSAYARSRAAAIRRKLKQEEQFRKQVQREYEKAMRKLDREEKQRTAAARKKERERLRAIKKAEDLAKLKAKIEAQLRKELGVIATPVHNTGRRLEVKED